MARHVRTARIHRVLSFLTIVLTSILSISSGHAQSQFEGVYVSVGAFLGVDQTSSTLDFSYTNLFAGSVAPPGFSVAGGNKLSNDNEVEVIPDVEAGYTFAIGNGFLVNLSAELDLRPAKGTLQISNFAFPNPTGVADSPTGYAQTTTIKSRNHFAIAVEPGVVVTDNLAAMFKLAVHHVEAELQTAASANLSSLVGPATMTRTFGVQDRLWGIGIGLAARYLFGDDWFVQPEVEWTWYQSTSMPAPSIRSPTDEVTITQTQKVTPERFDVGLRLGYQF